MSDQQFHKLAPADDVPPGGMKQYTVEGRPVALVNADGEFHAFEDVCTHQFVHLTEGELLPDGKVKCPLHGASFDVVTGEAKSLPAVKGVPVHELKIERAEIYVALNPERVKTGKRRRRTG
ncbi:non-heme iron oxygenase ferredoxin subunit [Rubrobacter indicoceani]|uniref:non-heme iron oxygenase ferredoxin subunit n=1 Tax=Rubrobacter indicoceani TaxID=2051957 RepID=UPI000E5AA10E|nr:non-heme iron oxygenase ferredoxin subunit [Rubrobacter indicoceani]